MCPWQLGSSAGGHVRTSKWQHREGWGLQGTEGSQAWRVSPEGLAGSGPPGLCPQSLALAGGPGSEQSRHYGYCLTLKMLNLGLVLKTGFCSHRRLWEGAEQGSQEGSGPASRPPLAGYGPRGPARVWATRRLPRGLSHLGLNGPSRSCTGLGVGAALPGALPSTSLGPLRCGCEEQEWSGCGPRSKGDHPEPGLRSKGLPTRPPGTCSL